MSDINMSNAPGSPAPPYQFVPAQNQYPSQTPPPQISYQQSHMDSSYSNPQFHNQQPIQPAPIPVDPQYQNFQSTPVQTPPPALQQQGSYYGQQQEKGMMPQQAGMQQHGIPQQAMQSQTALPAQPVPITYASAVPLSALGPGPAPVDCPACRTRAITRIEYESGLVTW
ncbi:hypothetical protein MMC20_006507 [Loxospora ochrophaea]|nr:hypothetical protein [Loxospora ochrophaea]